VEWITWIEDTDMAYLIETVHTDRDNTIDIQLTEDNEALIDHSVITRIVLKFSGSTQADIDSSTDPQFFDLSQTERVVFDLGLAGIPVGSYWMTVIVYDAVSTNGIEWEPKIKLKVT
jgi:hypothetical protein